MTMRHFMDSESLDALSVRCWPEMANMFGQWPYLGMARLADEGRAIACEGDTDGAMCAWIGESLGMGRCYLSDWLEHDEHTVTLWHPGHAPLDLCTPDSLRLGRHFNSGHPVVVDAVLTPERPITLMRLWCLEGRYRITACECRTAPPQRSLTGAHGLALIEDRRVPDWFDALCHEGMPHHLAVFSGHHAALLKRFARHTGVDWIDGV